MAFYLTLICSLPPAVHAEETISEIDPLVAGVVAVRNNALVRKVRIRADNAVVPDRDIIVVKAGQSGRYRLAGFPPDRILNVTVLPLGAVGTVPASPAAGWTMESFDIRPFPIRSNAGGEVEIQIGVTLATTGGNIPYVSANYNGLFNISVTY